MNKNARNVWLGISVFVFLMGLCMILWAETALGVLCYVTGGVLVAAAIVQALLQWKTAKDGGAGNGYISAMLLLLFGLLFLLRKDAAMQFWGFLLGALLIVDCLFKGGIAMQLKKAGKKAWVRTILVAAALLVCGVLMLFVPAEPTANHIVLIGIALCLDAIADVWAFVDCKRLLK
ncbi:MAG: DUF308 domain-containing protein [Clostridiales bacterium]|nr:DUF308 domain-containing protein [Clostridiales bacterium]